VDVPKEHCVDIPREVCTEVPVQYLDFEFREQCEPFTVPVCNKVPR
jgi:hypothetical protein